MHRSNVLTTEDTDPSNLLSIWKDITYALISSGHGSVLHYELNTASRTGFGPNNQESCDVVARSSRLQSSANSAENDGWTNEFDGVEESIVSSVDKSDSDEDIYDDLTYRPILLMILQTCHIVTLVHCKTLKRYLPRKKHSGHNEWEDTANNEVTEKPNNPQVAS
ncbi:hypothetical protein DL98DRAFT_598085 [Cadophora sp. DSE1049]|nr:hypothetical protein DL98DRAFT_598085 [Cadophora sp. DSE1049]